MEYLLDLGGHPRQSAHSWPRMLQYHQTIASFGRSPRSKSRPGTYFRFGIGMRGSAPIAVEAAIAGQPCSFQARAEARACQIRRIEVVLTGNADQCEQRITARYYHDGGAQQPGQTFFPSHSPKLVNHCIFVRPNARKERARQSGPRNPNGRSFESFPRGRVVSGAIP